MLDIKTWLESTGYNTTEERFSKPPALPYIVFIEDINVRGGDNENCIEERKINVELYSDKINKVAEKAIEDLLNEKSIEYKKERIWIDTENFFQTVYDFNFIEKFRR